MSQLSGKQKKFEYIEHPADIGIRAYGENLQQLFENAARGLYEILEIQGIQKNKGFKRTKNLSADSNEDLLVLFLNEILYIAIKEHLIFEEFSIIINSSGNTKNLHANMTGYKFNDIGREVKAVTYHHMKIENINGILQTDIIFDI